MPPSYWAIAPLESKPADRFEKVWQFDLTNNLISIGWGELGDVSKMGREELRTVVASTYPDKPPPTVGLIANMMWAFYHEIRPGDVVVARRGRMTLAAVGNVLQAGFYAPGRNPALPDGGYSHPNFLGVEWQEQPRDKAFPGVVFRMYALAKMSADQFRDLLGGAGSEPLPAEAPEAVEDGLIRNEFVLEKYLEDFIVSNFGTIFNGELEIFVDKAGNEGQQYDTDGAGEIDILAVDRSTKSFVVIELKKGRTSDQVVGQVLRYMGWVKKNLCENGEGVRGLVICRERDEKMSYALDMTQNVDVRYYSVSFKLSADS